MIIMDRVLNMDMFNLKKDQMQKAVYNKLIIISKDKIFRSLNLFHEIKETLV